MLDLNVDADELDCDSSPSTLNFSILNNTRVREIEDDAIHGGSELQLFPSAWLNLSSAPQVKKSRRGPRSRRTGRWESHIWDCGKQVYLGTRKYLINFALGDYQDDINELKDLSKVEFVHILRRQSTGRWEGRIGQFPGKKAYDQSVIKCNGREAVTNFEPSNCERKMTSSRNEGSGSNLGISLSLDGPIGKDTAIDLHFPRATIEFPDGKKLKERGAARNEVVPPLLPGFTNWPLKMPEPNNGGPILSSSSSSSAAASSGFSCPTIVSPYYNNLVPFTSSRPPQFHCTAFCEF